LQIENWIRLIVKTEMLPEYRMAELFDECNQLCNIIAQSIVTAKKRKEKKAWQLAIYSLHFSILSAF
jgi:hypothetical protein